MTNGNDLVAAYARQSEHFPRPVVEVALAMTDTGDRAQRYSQGQASFVWGMVRNILGAVFLSFWHRSNVQEGGGESENGRGQVGVKTTKLGM